jgi:hypothetical protein
MAPGDNPEPHDSAHHTETSLGDTFGGLGTDREFREEEIVIPSGMIVLPDQVTLLHKVDSALADRYDHYA